MGQLASSARALRFASRRAIGVSSRACIAPAHPVSVREPREFPEATTQPTLAGTISDELVEFYAFVFGQRGFRRLDMSFEQFLLVAAVVKPLDSPMGFEEAGGWGERSPISTRPKVNSKPGSNVCGEAMWLPAVVVRRARLERIPGTRQRLVPIALHAIAPSGCAPFDEEICNG
jgi:hypothetical protein